MRGLMKQIGSFKGKMILILVTTTALLVSTITITNYFNTRAILQKDQKEKEQLIEKDIIGMIQGADVSYGIIEKTLTDKMEKYSSVLLEMYKQNPNMDKWDLQQLKKQMDGLDIFVINRDLVVTHSSRKEDLGLDFNKIEGFNTLLKQRFNEGVFTSDRTEVSTATGLVSKFSYAPTQDRKYIIELGATLNDYSDLFKDMDLSVLTKNLISENKYIKDIQIFTVEADGSIGPALNKESKSGKKFLIDSSYAKIGEKAITGNKSAVINKGQEIHKFIPKLDSQNTADNLKNARLIQIVYDNQYFYQELQKSKVVALIIILVSITLSTICSILIARSISKPIQQLGKVIDYTSELNFTTSPDLENLKRRKDDFNIIATKYEHMLVSIKNAFSQVLQSSEQLAAMAEEFTSSSNETKTAANQIAESIQAVSKEADHQSTMVDEAMKGIVTITDELKRVTLNIHEVHQSVDETVHISKSGNEFIDYSIRNMQKIESQTRHTKNVVTRLGEKSSEIEGILSLITSISQQTNLLALNAAIESARAGEAGKGFSVVADEVRKLAEETSQAANQINELINEIKDEINQATDAMESGYDAVKEGNDLIQNAGNSFEQILLSIENVSKQSTEASNTSNEVQEMSTKLLDSVHHISTIFTKLTANAQEVAAATEQQTATIDEVSAASQNLSVLADELRDEVANFKI